VIIFQADNSLASKQLEGRKQNKERITLTICYNGDGSDRLSLWVYEPWIIAQQLVKL
jgi:hypothetical protein